MRCVLLVRRCRLVVLSAGLGLVYVGVATGQEFEPPIPDEDAQRRLLNSALGPVGDIAVNDSGTQLMIIDIMDVVLPGDATRGRGTGALGLAPLPDGQSWYVATRAGAETVVFSGPNVDDVATSRPIAGHQETRVTAFLRSLGESTGAAFQLQVGSTTPLRFSGEGIVVQPTVIRDQARQALEARITRFAAGSPVTQVLNAYCLEFLKGPPSVDQVFKIADAQLQTLYRPAANILKAGRQLIAQGVFEDHPLDYIHSVKQWALWVAEEKSFSFDSFSERFLAHAEDNFAASGLDWTEQVETLVRGGLAERWTLINNVLDVAGDMPGGTTWLR